MISLLNVCLFTSWNLFFASQPSTVIMLTNIKLLQSRFWYYLSSVCKLGHSTTTCASLTTAFIASYIHHRSQPVPTTSYDLHGKSTWVHTLFTLHMAYLLLLLSTVGIAFIQSISRMLCHCCNCHAMFCIFGHGDHQGAVNCFLLSPNWRSFASSCLPQPVGENIRLLHLMLQRATIPKDASWTNGTSSKTLKKNRGDKRVKQEEEHLWQPKKRQHRWEWW